MRALNGLLGLALLAASTGASAGELTKLSDVELDSIAAGSFTLIGISRAGPSLIDGGSSFALSDIAQVQTVQTAQLSPPASSLNASVFAQSQSSAQSSGVGPISSFTGGSLFIAIFPRN